LRGNSPISLRISIGRVLAHYAAPRDRIVGLQEKLRDAEEDEHNCIFGSCIPSPTRLFNRRAIEHFRPEDSMQPA
jgi:hypothetical protein